MARELNPLRACGPDGL